jgi:hypothetical protein
MHATNVSEKDQRFTPMKRSLQALHFFRQPRLDVLVGKRILHVGVGVTLIEQEGQKEGGEKNRARGLDLESSLHGTCEVVQNVTTKPLLRCQRQTILNSCYNVGSEFDKNVTTILVCSQTQPLTISIPFCRHHRKSKHWQDMKRVLHASLGKETTPGRQIGR